MTARDSASPRSSDHEPMTERIKGILSPVLTPFKGTTAPTRSGSSATAGGCSPTTSALPSSGPIPRRTRFPDRSGSIFSERLVDAGIEPRRLMPGTGCCSLTETAHLTSQAVKLGCIWRPDASPVLLQRRHGRRLVSQFCGDDRARGRQAFANLSLPYRRWRRSASAWA